MAENAIVVAGWALMPPSNDVDEPRIRDVDLADRLGIKQLRNIRHTINSLIERGEIAGVLHGTEIVRYELRPGNWQERELTVYWLTEKQALRVCMTSKGARAAEVKTLLENVFVAYRTGQLVPAAPQPQPLATTTDLATAIATLSAQIASLASIHDRVAALEAAAPHARQPLGVIGRIGASVIRGRLRDYARLLEVPGKRGSRQSHLRAADQELRERIGYPMSRGSSWDMLDQSLEGMAARHLHQMIERAQRFTSERQPSKQTTLWSLKGGA